ncbi:hypothetical protein GTA08_BOTSDO08680 [Neofusicoccum parvum]|uniref:Uncharacterized protein n=1 Tax=Neofusicoccum parvum TaxID=310453 RepID=A0ACB5SLH8_9PEZI|nr:hypothetical protein GTA08_BOTSDO08680 [Neofusicoccum parvum]
MASLASILHHGSSASGGGPTTTTRSTSSKSTPAPISTSSPMGAQQHQHTSPPPGIGGGASFPPPGLTAAVHPLSPTTAASAAHVAVQDLPFYHQLEQVQHVRDGKFQASPGGAASAAAAAAAALDDCYQTDGPAVAGDESTRSLTPTGAGPGAKVFERQIEEVEDAKEALRKAGVVTGAAQGQWGQQQQQDFQVKVQVQGDGHAKMRVMGAVEEADRDEGVRV